MRRARGSQPAAVLAGAPPGAAAHALAAAQPRPAPPHTPSAPRREFPAFVERYIAGTSTLFRDFIDKGLGELEAAEGQGGGQGGGQPPAPAQQSGGEPAGSRRGGVPPPALQRPPLSPAGAGSGSYAGAYSPSATMGAASPGASPAGSASSAARLAALRERMGGLRVSGEGGPASSGPSSSRASATAELGTMASSLEGLQARLANLQASRRSSGAGV